MQAVDSHEAEPAGFTARQRSRINHLRHRYIGLDRLVRTIEIYRDQDGEALSLRVVNRGIFLAVSMMVVLLFVLAFVTSRLPGINEIVVPLLSVPTEVDVGAIVTDTVARQRNALFDIAGVITLLVSAIATARALRFGLSKVAQGVPTRLPSWLAPANLLIAAGTAAIMLASWLLALTTVVRTRAINIITGVDIPRMVIDFGKVGVVMLSITLLSAVLLHIWRKILPQVSVRDRLLASAGVGLLVTGANFVLLYSYISALLDPSAASGLVLVFMTMAWVNAVVRLLFLSEFWLVAARQGCEGA